MGASGDFTKPAWNNPIDTDLDSMRDTFNFLLCQAVAGSHVAPGWISTISGGAEPDTVTLTKSDGRRIKVTMTWV